MLACLDTCGAHVRAMNRVFGTVANSSSPEGADNDIGPVVGVYVCGKQHEAVSLLAQYNGDIVRVSEWKHMIRPSDGVPNMYRSALTTLAFLPSVTAKVVAAVAYISGQVRICLCSFCLSVALCQPF